jgi:hypothetical protein
MSNFHILTLATKNDGYYNALVESAKKNNIDLVTLGFGQKWSGFTMKINLINKYLESLPDNDIVVISDAYDVILLQNASKILKKFKSFNKPIVISRDAQGNFIFSYMQSKVYKKCNNVQICAGLYMGYVWAIKLLYSDMCKNNNCIENNKDDQMMLTNVCNNNDFFNKYIDIDNDYIIFYTTVGSGFSSIYSPDSNSDIINNKLIINNTNQEPSFVHGPNYTKLDLILNTYNLPLNNNYNRNITEKLFIYFKYEYLQYYITDILILILILTLIIYFIRYIKFSKY